LTEDPALSESDTNESEEVPLEPEEESQGVIVVVTTVVAAAACNIIARQITPVIGLTVRK
jgi:hypothetical protein